MNFQKSTYTLPRFDSLLKNPVYATDCQYVK